MKRIMGVIFYSLDWTSDLGEDIYEILFLIKKMLLSDKMKKIGHIYKLVFQTSSIYF